ncbi:MAG: glycosyltransferase family 4 protein, partial [Dehalococcoidia bacterium]|nr:glycosyltransferase family 4 protein [Dehalococcoidia bacterium]
MNQHITHLARQFTALGHYVRIIAPSSAPVEQLGRDDLIVIGRPFPMPANGSIARIALSLNLAGPVKAMLAEQRFDVVHVHEPLAGLLPITVLRFADCVTIGTFHAFAGSRMAVNAMAYYYGQPILRRWFRKLDGKIAVSEASAEFVGRYFRGYYNIIPNGIDYPHFAGDVAPIEHFDDGRPNILFVGRLEPRKGLKYLLRAFQLIKREFPDSRLIVVGPGDRERVGYEQWVNSVRLRDVHFTGFVSYTDLARYYRTATVCCAPSTGGESFGIVLLEAMASGKPVVASNIRGYAAVLTDGVEGYLAPPKDVTALAAGIGQLLANPALRAELGANGRVKAR